MSRISKIFKLSWSDRRLLARSAFVMCAAVAAVRLLPAAYFAAALATRLPRVRNQSHTPERIGWAASVAARYVPGASCLAQAVAARHLLERAGHIARINIGVAHDSVHGFQAHAWVEAEGRVLLGGADCAARYHTLPLHPESAN
jgi:hypothetical protein